MNSMNKSPPAATTAATLPPGQQTPAGGDRTGLWRRARNTATTACTGENGARPLPTRMLRPGPPPTPGEQPFWSCPAVYSGRLVRHEADGHSRPGTDSGARPLSCPVEGRHPGFIPQPYRIHHAYIHPYIHPRERPHSCPAESCNRRFLRPSHMRAHMKVHRGSQPYPCHPTACNTQLRTTGSMSQPMKPLPTAIPPAVGGFQGVRTGWTVHWHHDERGFFAQPVPAGMGEPWQAASIPHQRQGPVPSGPTPRLWRGWVDQTAAASLAEQGVPPSSIRQSGVVESVATEPDASPPAESLADAQWLLEAGFTLAGYSWPQQEPPSMPAVRPTTPVAGSVPSVCVKQESPQHSAPTPDP